jgi:hypothetical protein
MIARLLVRWGKRCANENIRRPVFVGVIRFLAKPGRSRQTSRKTKALPAAWEKSSLVGRIIKEANLSASEFIGWLESALEGRDVAWSA